MIKVREVKESDLLQLVKLFDLYRNFYKKESDIQAAKAFLSERIVQQDSKIYVAEDDSQQLVGFVQLYPVFSSTRMKKLWLLNDLFVHATCRGKGIAIKLVENAQYLAKKTSACGVLLETEKTNLIGNNLYQKMGFEISNQSNFYEWHNN